MDFGKIINACKIPTLAAIILTLAMFISASIFLPPIGNNLSIFFGLLTFVTPIYLGYQGAKKFKFDYIDAALGGAFLFLAAGIAILLVDNLFFGGRSSGLYPIPFFVVAGLLLALVGTFIAKHTK